MPAFQRNSQNALTNAAFGYQNVIQGTNAAAPSPLTLVHLAGLTPITAVTFTAGVTYQFFLPSAGASAATVILKGTFTTAPTVTVYPCGADGLTQRVGSTSTTITLTSGTALATAISPLQGESGLILTITPGAGGLTLTQAEYNAL